MEPSASSAFTRVSPLRGGMSQDSIVQQTRNVQNGLATLRDDHYNILAKIRDEVENEKNLNTVATAADDADAAGQDNVPESPKNGKRKVSGGGDSGDSMLEDRIASVTNSLEALEMGLEESNVIIALYDHFNRMESDRSILRLEMNRVIDENDWLREELSETQRRLQEALADLAVLQDEKKQWEFQEELKSINEINVRPVTPSKIPVGSWRVEEEKELNRALAGPNGLLDSNRRSTERSASPAPSKIPIGGWRGKLTVYKKVMESQEEVKTKNAEAVTRSRQGQYFKLNASKTPSKIPIR